MGLLELRGGNEDNLAILRVRESGRGQQDFDEESKAGVEEGKQANL